MSSQLRKEEARREVLRFLATRHLLAHTVDAVRRGVNRDGFDFDAKEVESALQILEGLELVSSRTELLGATKYFQATAKGVLEHERL